MNIEELMNSRKRLEQFYKKELEKSKSSDNKDVYEGELRDIEKEIAIFVIVIIFFILKIVYVLIIVIIVNGIIF